MNILTKTLLLVLLLIEIYSVLPPTKPERPSPAKAQTLSGIIHVHSTFSDGGGSPQEIAEAAKSAGADFLILTDHNTTEARKQFEKRYDSVDLFVEMEASTPGGHTVSFSSLSAAAPLADQRIVELSFNQFLGTDSKENFFEALAHPSNIKNPWNRLDRYAEGYELINFDSLWQRQLSDSVIGFATTLFVYPLNNYLAALRFFDVYKKDLVTWDSMTSTGPGHFVLLAHDTHAKLKINNDWWWKWPGYEQTFKLGSNIIYLDEPPSEDFLERKKQIYASLRAGKLALTYHGLFPFSGNDWNVNCGQGVKRSGSVLSFIPGNCQFEVSLPDGFPFPVIGRLIHDGEQIKEFELKEGTMTMGVDAPGTYRVEIWVKRHTLFRIFLNREVPYVFYNPIYLR